MRFLVQISIPVEAGNALIKDGRLGEIIQSILADLKPEAAYFTEVQGKRTGMIFVDIQEPSQIPRIAEPWFLALKASVEFHPAMNPEDLMKAGPDLEQAAKTYG